MYWIPVYVLINFESVSVNLCPQSYNLSPYISKLLLIHCGIIKNNSITDNKESDRKFDNGSEVGLIKYLDSEDIKI